LAEHSVRFFEKAEQTGATVCAAVRVADIIITATAVATKRSRIALWWECVECDVE